MNEVRLGLTLSFILFAIAILPMVFSQKITEEGPYIMNASLEQPIYIQLSGNLTAGIFFTNTTTHDVQYPITNMTAWNNATKNYPGGINSTGYWVRAGPGNTANIKICHCACANLTCVGGLCSPSDTLSVGCADPGNPSDCVGFTNYTSDTMGEVGDSVDYGFPGTLTNQIIGANVTPGQYVNLRYWLDPYPDNKPSGNYQTQLKIYATEVEGTCGSCPC